MLSFRASSFRFSNIDRTFFVPSPTLNDSGTLHNIESHLMFSKPSPDSASTAPQSLAGLFCAWLGIILFLKWPTLTEPPVWDAVFGLFPAAGDLADSGFNLSSLLQKPGCRTGGPNTHSESLVTWISAGVMWLTGKGPRAFAILHLLHFCTAAWTLAVLHRFTTVTWGRAMAWVFCATLLLCPLFRVQVGSLYFEIPLAACTVAAVVSFANGQLPRAVVWSSLAILVKQAGLVVAGALAVAAFCQSGSLTKRIGRGASFAVTGLVAALWPLVATPVLAGVKDQSPPSSWWQFLNENVFYYLTAIPDITAAYILVALIGCFRFRELWNSLANLPAPSNTTSAALGVSFFLVVFYGLFFFVTPYVARIWVISLPRYFVFILPFIFFALTHWLVLLISPRRAAVVLCLVAVLFVANREGFWYPKDKRDEISILERGESYRWVVAVQREAAGTAANLPDDVMIYYGWEDHFFQKYPWLGYASRTHPGGRALCFSNEVPPSTTLKEFPERFFVIYSNPHLFGYQAHQVLRSASKDPTRRVRLFRRCQRGPFHIDVVEVTTVPPSASAEVAL